MFVLASIGWSWRVATPKHLSSCTAALEKPKPWLLLCCLRLVRLLVLKARLPYFIQVADKSIKVGRYCPFAFSSFVALCGNDLVSLPFFRFGKFQMIKSNLGHSLSPLPSWCGKGMKLVESMLFPALLKTIWICYLNNLGGPLRSSFI